MEITDKPIDMVVGFDHRAAAAEMLKHMIAKGYKRIASVGARMDHRVRRRRDSYRAIMQETGLYDPDLDISTDEPSSVTTGRKLVEQILSKRRDIDAFFCHNDDLALGCLFACQAACLKVPEDVGITGFNDMEFMSATFPPLTSITTHRFDMGRRAVDLALQAVENKNIPERIVNLGYDLAVRESI